MRWKALIVAVGGSIVGECMMANVSVAGAKLFMRSPADVPDNFVLVLAKKGEVRRLCEVTWRSDDSIGVRFVRRSPADDEALPLDVELARISGNDEPEETGS
jgi:hypothetical protein